MADLLQLASVGAFAFIIFLVFAFGIYGFILWISKKKFDIAYVDKYKQIVQVTKMNCPNEIKEKELVKVSDKNFTGIRIGYIYGKNFIRIKEKWYHLFVLARQKRKIWNPLSWGTPDLLAVAEKDKISITDGFNIKWIVGGLDYEGYFISAAEGDLTPEDIFTKTTNLVGLKQANITMKKISELMEIATDANPNIKANQKVASELPSRERT